MTTTNNKLFDIRDFITQDNGLSPELLSPDQVQSADISGLAEVGVLLNANNRGGTFIMEDFHPVCSYSQIDGVEVLPLEIALLKYEWLREKYYWNLIQRDQDEVTQFVNDQPTPQGFFIHVKEGAKVKVPYQAALYMGKADIAQGIHNIIIVDDNAELNLITGCLSHQSVGKGLHMAATETYIGKNATLTNTMVHSWGPKITVLPKAATEVASGGRFISNYISMRPAAIIRTNPVTYLNGAGSSAKYMTIILGSEGADIQTGGNVYLNGEDSRAELVHRSVCTGGQIVQSGLMIGHAKCRAHVDCSGMLLNPGKDGFILSTPGVQAFHPEAELSHEASIGKIAPEQVEYLQSRGIEEHDAISMIIRGFLDADIEGLGEELDAHISEIAELASQGSN